MNPVRQRQCGAKVRYTTEKEAADAAKFMWKKYSARMNTYICSWCDYWHIGRVRRTASKRKRG